MGIVIMSLGFQEKTIYILNYTFGNFEIIFDLTRVCWVRLDLLTIKLKENIIYLWLGCLWDIEKRLFLYIEMYFWKLLLEIIDDQEFVGLDQREYYLFVIRIFWRFREKNHFYICILNSAFGNFEIIFDLTRVLG